MFRTNLLSKKDTGVTSIDYLLRLTFKGHCTGRPAVIRSLRVLDQISDSSETAHFLMKDMQQLMVQQSVFSEDADGKGRYCVMTADAPLYAQMH